MSDGGEKAIEEAARDGRRERNGRDAPLVLQQKRPRNCPQLLNQQELDKCECVLILNGDREQGYET